MYSLFPADNSFFIYLDHRYVRVWLKDIRYIEAIDHHVKIHTDQSVWVPHLGLKEIEAALPAAGFTRVNRGILVSLARVVSFTRDEVAVGPDRFVLTDKYRPLFLEKVTVLQHEEQRPSRQER